MKIKYEQSPQKYQRCISENKLSIYDHIEIGDPDLWIPIIPNNATTELVTSEDTDNLKSVFVQKFQGKTLNKKLQIPLPSDFFN